VVLSTASPFKFAADMLRSLGREAPESGFDAQNELAALTGQTVPAPLAALKGKPERFTTAVARGEMRESIRSWLMDE
jgi:threonine synthase